jgi:hypothetical protein
VQHALLDRRSSRASVHKDHDIRAGIVVEGIAWRSLGNMHGDVAWLNTSLGTGERDLLRGNINRLEEVSIRISHPSIFNPSNSSSHSNLPAAPIHHPVDPAKQS